MDPIQFFARYVAEVASVPLMRCTTLLQLDDDVVGALGAQASTTTMGGVTNLDDEECVIWYGRLCILSRV